MGDDARWICQRQHTAASFGLSGSAELSGRFVRAQGRRAVSDRSTAVSGGSGSGQRAAGAGQRAARTSGSAVRISADQCQARYSAGEGSRDRTEPAGQRYSNREDARSLDFVVASHYQSGRSKSGDGESESGIHAGSLAGKRRGWTGYRADRQPGEPDDHIDGRIAGKSDQGVLSDQRARVPADR